LGTGNPAGDYDGWSANRRMNVIAAFMRRETDGKALLKTTGALCGVFSICLALLSGCASGRVRSPEASKSEGPAQTIQIKEFGVGPGDELEVMVYQHEDLTRKIRVPNSGIIFFPMVGELNVNGVGITEVRRTLTERLGSYVVNPQVNVEVTTLRSQKVYVLGEVNVPMVFPLESPTRALEAISKAGGFTPNASGSSVLLIQGEATAPHIERLDMTDYVKQGGAQNPFLQPGDIIYVPRTFVADLDKFFTHITTALLPALILEQGIALYPQVRAAINNKGATSTTNVVISVPAH